MIELHFGAPQLVWLAMVTFNVVTEAVNHGKPRDDKHNAYTQLVGSAIGLAILWWGGFFS